MADAQTEEAKKLEEDWHRQLFGVRRSVRYHLHRRKFFETLKVLSDFLVIVSGGTVAVLSSSTIEHKTAWNVAVGAFIAVVGSFDLVIGFSTKARDYRDLVREFSQLERDMTASPVTNESLSKFSNRRLEIEEDEPPRLRVLNNCCHNELIIAMDYPKDDLGDIKIWQSIPMQLIDVFPSRVKTCRQIEEMRAAKEKAKEAAIAAKAARKAAQIRA